MSVDGEGHRSRFCSTEPGFGLSAEHQLRDGRFVRRMALELWDEA